MEEEGAGKVGKRKAEGGRGEERKMEKSSRKGRGRKESRRRKRKRGRERRNPETGGQSSVGGRTHVHSAQSPESDRPWGGHSAV